MADTQFADEEEYKEYLRWKRKQEQIAQEQARAAAEPRAPVPEWAPPPEMRPAPAPVAQLPPRYANIPYRAPMGVGVPPSLSPSAPTPEQPPRPPVDWGAAAQIPEMVGPPQPVAPPIPEPVTPPPDNVRAMWDRAQRGGLTPPSVERDYGPLYSPAPAPGEVEAIDALQKAERFRAEQALGKQGVRTVEQYRAEHPNKRLDWGDVGQAALKGLGDITEAYYAPLALPQAAVASTARRFKEAGDIDWRESDLAKRIEASGVAIPPAQPQTARERIISPPSARWADAGAALASLPRSPGELVRNAETEMARPDWETTRAMLDPSLLVGLPGIGLAKGALASTGTIAKKAAAQIAQEAVAPATRARGLAIAKQLAPGLGIEDVSKAILPRELGGAKPRYGYRDKAFELEFESDIDKALYIVAQVKPSARDAAYLDWLRRTVPEYAVLTDTTIRGDGAIVRARIRALAKDAEPGILRVGQEPLNVPKGAFKDMFTGEVGKVAESVPPIELPKPSTATGATSVSEGLPKPPTTTVQNDVVAALRKEVLELSKTERGSFSLKAWKGDDGTLYVERSTGGGGYSYSTISPDGTIKPGMPEIDLGEPIERMTLNSGKAVEGVPSATGANAAPPAGTPPGGRPPVPPAGAEPPVPPKPPDAVPPPPVDPVPPVPPSGAVDAERAGNILLSKYPEAIRDELKAVYESDPAKFEAARRGVRSDAQVRADAIALIDSVGGNGTRSVGKWKPGQAWNAEEILALREVLARRTRAVMEAREAVGASGDSTSNLVRLKVAIDEQRRAQKAIAGITAESGRALRQFRKDVSGALVSGREEQLRVILERLGGRDMTESLLDKLSKLDLDNPEAVYRFLRNSDTTPSYLMEVFYNSILSSTGTHFRNAIGNTLAAGFVPIETGVAAAIDIPLAKLSGRARERFFGEVPAGTFAAARALKDGLRKALYIVQNGYSLDDVAMLEMRRSEAFSGKVGAVLNQPSRLLVASDAIFRSIHYSAALNMGAYRMASKAGLKGQERVARIAELLTSPPEELMAYAGKMARYRVYQSAPDIVARGLMNVASPTLGVGKFTIQPVKFVLPFIPTPINLAKYGLERSPLGIVTIPIKVWRKDPEAADAIARWLIGSTITGAVVAYAADGKITGAAPENPVERDLFYRQGKQPYSVLIGDRWVPYNMMEPLNQPLVMASSIVKALRAGKDPGSTLTSMAGSVAKGVAQQRYLTGVADLINVIEDPERYADKPVERTVVSFGVPFSSLSRGIAQTIDPTIRRAEGLGETLKSAIPGQSQSLEPRQNVWGEDIVRESSPLFPSAISTVKNDPLDQELARLGVTVGFVGDQVKRIPLTAQEQTEYQRAAGEATRKYLQSLMEHPVYQAATEMDKAKLLERASKRIKDAEAGRFYVKIGGPQIEAMIRKVEINPAYRNATPQVREALLKRTIERTRAAMNSTGGRDVAAQR